MVTQRSPWPSGETGPKWPTFRTVHAQRTVRPLHGTPLGKQKVFLGGVGGWPLHSPGGPVRKALGACLPDTHSSSAVRNTVCTSNGPLPREPGQPPTSLRPDAWGRRVHCQGRRCPSIRAPTNIVRGPGSGLGCPPQRGCCRTVRARCGPFPVFPGILPGGEAHHKPLWRVFPNACGWSPKAFG